MEDIFEGSAVGIPVRPEILFALSSKITTYARGHHSDQEIRNAVNYVYKLPAEFKNCIFSDFLQIKSIHKLLSNIRIYDDWFLRTGRNWEDYDL